MIKVRQVATTKAEVHWDTGHDLMFLLAMKKLIELRNEDKERIIRLEVEERCKNDCNDTKI